MKNVKFLLIATLCLAFSQVNLFAQADGVFGMGISYAPTEYISKTDDDSHSMEMNTINIKVFDILIPISSSDICLDMGFGALCTWGDKKKNGISNKTSLFGMDILAGFSYAFNINELITLYPYVDLALDLYLSGKNKVSGKSIDTYETDLFEKNSDYHKAVVNYCFGVKVQVGRIYFGLGRKAPITNFYNSDDVKQNIYRTEFTIGFNLLK